MAGSEKGRLGVYALILGFAYLALVSVLEYLGAGLYGAGCYLIHNTFAGVMYGTLLLNGIGLAWLGTQLRKKPVSETMYKWILGLLIVMIGIDITGLIGFGAILLFLMGFPFHIFCLVYCMRNKASLSLASE